MARTAGSHSADTAPRIRAAAQRLFAQHGYAAVSMRQIAAEVGVQVGALYNYTSDKQSLLFDLMVVHLEDLLDALPEPDTAAGPMQALDEFVRFHIRFHAARPEEVFIAYMELRNLSPENFAAVESLRRLYEDRLTAILDAGQARGVFRVADTRVATMAIIAMLTGVNTWFRETGRLSLSEVEAIYGDMTRRLVAG
ncbi:transcriptional regulator, TetR family protein [Pseudooceanicola batsensis HTCC2597]|uniref:Transcriptional regulator, TetR family protein n=1 Tax=Pseudooceanicola batsensis (strain ATCC BAA-863 / DSM 15984 / KCTC 12145 / HTCC2597) TaxID=252305 RepID=A3U205_PSEBH|nr:TetR/AcrR family transcriptional regulator [Pseudooceanicola batsensis]EAQ01939.1 transcriptional regulator, TetR family protein [Pseudooceanicola batsensis HTCC2597]